MAAFAVPFVLASLVASEAADCQPGWVDGSSVGLGCIRSHTILQWLFRKIPCLFKGLDWNPQLVGPKQSKPVWLTGTAWWSFTSRSS